MARLIHSFYSHCDPLPNDLLYRYGKCRVLSYAVAETESMEMQSFVLNFLKAQCPWLAPSVVFTDGATVDEKYITDIFPNARALLCTFHIFQLDLQKRLAQLGLTKSKAMDMCKALRDAKTESLFDRNWAALQETYSSVAQ